jgi:cytochrome c553
MTYMVAYLSEAYLREIAEHYSQLEPRYEAPATPATRGMLERGKVLVSSGDPARGLPGCAACHGTDLAGLEPAIPGLLGLSPEYIGAQLGAWRGRHRRAAEPDCMARIALLLAPEDISAAAAWIASRRAPTRTRAAPAGSLQLPLECGSVSQQSRSPR